ncbi:MAG: flagellar motor switch protein FliG [Pseudomonadales bacterium]|nr:flagellar motor switch protein FliG [Pseudomonadales bacterium]MCP5184743.1 flagellar motor switch protein FliG [Pseudomonadales bacterium]
MSEIPAENGKPSRVEQAAILLLSLGEEEAAKVLKFLDPREVQRVGEAMAALRSIPRSSIDSVVESFLEDVTEQSGLALGVPDYLRKMLVNALGEHKATTLLERISGGSTGGLEKLRWMDPRAIADFMKEEHPQVQAIVLSYLEAETAGEVLGYINDPAHCADIVMRVARLDSVSPTALAELAAVLEQHAGRQAANRFAQLGGRRNAAEIVNKLGRGVDQAVLEKMREVDESLAQLIQEQMFVFDNLSLIDDRGIQTLLREVSTDMLVLALKGADPLLAEKFFANMSKRAAELLRDDMEAKGPVRLSEVEAAQKEIVGIARRLADEGELVIAGSGEEMV